MKTTLEELQAFAAIVDRGSATAAAAELGQTVSGISRALGRLEEKLATTLLNRTTRRMELTEEGQLFLARARTILASVEDAEEQLALRRQQPAGRLRVNAATPFMLHVIVPLVAKFRERYPLIELELNTDELFIDLLEQRTDVAIRIGALKDSSLHARFLGTSGLRLLASPDYLARHGAPTTAADLDNHILLGFSQPDSLNHWPISDANGNPKYVKPAIAVSSGETLRQLALEGCGILCLSDFMTRQDIAAGRLVQVLAAQTLPVRQTVNAVYYRNTQLAARIACFLDFVAEHSGW
ncbi:LysR family transcriptional regulator [Chitinimonas sp.]|uniref:LysR family transcriptional regulator n=1 Tax=Chitinimonas sp. TaxID=1934313 RepID=UPI002F935ED2